MAPGMPRRGPARPILEPTGHCWVSRLITNPGVVKIEDRVDLPYTARGEDGEARLGYARIKSLDQTDKRLPYPVWSPGHWYEPDGIEG